MGRLTTVETRLKGSRFAPRQNQPWMFTPPTS